jgi:hypothetical protein
MIGMTNHYQRPVSSVAEMMLGVNVTRELYGGEDLLVGGWVLFENKS